MLSPASLGLRARLVGALAAAAACVAAGIATVAACLTAPPPDPSTGTNLRPEIWGSTQPPTGLLAAWPPDGRFLVPVYLPDPNAPCTWRVFDKDMESTAAPIERGEQLACITSVLDGGVVLQDFTIVQPTDGHCHVLTFVVAHGFSAGMVPDSIGGDFASWEYEPPGALCNFYDAGSFQDGAFPPADAGMDTVPITPESGPAPDAGAEP